MPGRHSRSWTIASRLRRLRKDLQDSDFALTGHNGTAGALGTAIGATGVANWLLLIGEFIWAGIMVGVALWFWRTIALTGWSRSLGNALPRGPRRYPLAVATNRDVLTAAELDQLSPSERAQAVREGVVEDLDQVPEDFRRQVEATARRLSADLDQSVSE